MSLNLTFKNSVSSFNFLWSIPCVIIIAIIIFQLLEGCFFLAILAGTNRDDRSALRQDFYSSFAWVREFPFSTLLFCHEYHRVAWSLVAVDNFVNFVFTFRRNILGALNWPQIAIARLSWCFVFLSTLKYRWTESPDIKITSCVSLALILSQPVYFLDRISTAVLYNLRKICWHQTSNHPTYDFDVLYSASVKLLCTISYCWIIYS